jgi:hypothetical protein
MYWSRPARRFSIKSSDVFRGGGDRREKRRGGGDSGCVSPIKRQTADREDSDERERERERRPLSRRRRQRRQKGKHNNRRTAAGQRRRRGSSRTWFSKKPPLAGRAGTSLRKTDPANSAVSLPVVEVEGVELVEKGKQREKKQRGGRKEDERDYYYRYVL